ncbi:MAG: NAD(+) synthase [Steroidobacteraceae bacterium]
MSLADSISSWLRDQVRIANAQGLVFGLSGGIDSAVVARLCQLAVGDRCVGVVMPCHSAPQDEEDARLVAGHFKIPVLHVPLEEPFDALTTRVDTAFNTVPGLRPHATDDPKARVPRANVKPRLRMATLYFVANRLNYLVAGTGNRSEITIGYYTKYGDGGVDLLPIGGLVKRDVWDLARELGVPSRVIEKAPSAGLWLGQTDEAEMGFTYAELEEFITRGPAAVPEHTAQRIQHLATVSEHKRALPPTP